jgi:MFS family permease
MNRETLAVLFPLNLTAFICFLMIGISLPVLPLYVHNELGLSEFMVGIVVGAQFAAALLTRAIAGAVTDAKGGKYSMLVGSCVGMASALMYVLSLFFSTTVSVSILILGRFLLGSAASMTATGALAWGIRALGSSKAGTVMGWNGIATYCAYIAGAPIGVMFYQRFGFSSIALLTLIMPILAFIIVRNRKTPVFVAAPKAQRSSFFKVFRVVWMPGVGLALASVSFGTITAFLSLLFFFREWGSPAMAFIYFGISYIVSRLVFGHLPDKIGGARIAIVTVIIEAIGQGFIWLATTPELAYIGIALTGFGYSLIYPSFGVEAIKKAPPESRGTALGAYTVFMDIALFFTVPLVGHLMGYWGVSSAYLISGICAACATILAIALYRTREHAL